jgi:CheY-like chemotaxis protein
VISPVIMIVDDEPVLLGALSELFELEGYRVQAVNNSTRAIEQIRQDQPDLVLLDVLLSGEDGRNICSLLKDAAGPRKLPVLLMSAVSDIGAAVADAGADGAVSKPFDTGALLDLIESHLQPR